MRKVLLSLAMLVLLVGTAHAEYYTASLAGNNMEILIPGFDAGLGNLYSAQLNVSFSGQTSTNGQHTHGTDLTSGTLDYAGAHSHNAVGSASGSGLTLTINLSTSQSGNHNHQILGSTVTPAGSHAHNVSGSASGYYTSGLDIFYSGSPLVLAISSITTSSGGLHIHTLTGVPATGYSGLHSHNIGTLLATSTITYSYEPAQATPIPGAVWLLGTGVLGLFGLRKRIFR